MLLLLWLCSLVPSLSQCKMECYHWVLTVALCSSCCDCGCLLFLFIAELSCCGRLLFLFNSWQSQISGIYFVVFVFYFYQGIKTSLAEVFGVVPASAAVAAASSSASLPFLFGHLTRRSPLICMHKEAAEMAELQKVRPIKALTAQSTSQSTTTLTSAYLVFGYTSSVRRKRWGRETGIGEEIELVKWFGKCPTPKALSDWQAAAPCKKRWRGQRRKQRQS